MKNATKHAEDLRSLFKKLLKDHKPQPPQKQEPIKALVRGIMSYDVHDSKVDDAVHRIEKEFVDLNELRVATELEVIELLGSRYPDIEHRVELITHALNAIFEKEHTLNLERMATISKRDVRQFLRDLPDLHPFAEAYVMLFSFEGHAIPVDEEMVAYLRDHHVVDDKTTLVDAQRFVEHHIKAEECHDFYQVFRKAAQTEGGKKKAKAKA